MLLKDQYIYIAEVFMTLHYSWHYELNCFPILCQSFRCYNGNDILTWVCVCTLYNLYCTCMYYVYDLFVIWCLDVFCINLNNKESQLEQLNLYMHTRIVMYILMYNCIYFLIYLRYGFAYLQPDTAAQFDAYSQKK